MANANEKDPPPSLSDVIRACGGGQFHDDATAELQALVKEVRRVGETVGGTPSGTLTIKLKLTLDRGIFDVTAALAVKSPAVIQARTIMYDDNEGALYKNDQRQLTLTGVVKDGTPDVTHIRTARES